MAAVVRHKTEPTIATQVKYLTTFAEKLGKERVDAESAAVIKAATSPHARSGSGA
ncbi:hypothetical protein ACIO7M_19650 [Streptomyces toxytricini]|uniref:Uncharacterized protein n=1 Tax=Streptomyces toxytricini TaxID=67369 RepID=A0ABW8EJ74_STRT5